MDDTDRDETIYCPSCGERIHRSVKYCRHCGAPNRFHPDHPAASPPGARDQSDERGAEQSEWADDWDDGWDDGRDGRTTDRGGRDDHWKNRDAEWENRDDEWENRDGEWNDGWATGWDDQPPQDTDTPPGGRDRWSAHEREDHREPWENERIRRVERGVWEDDEDWPPRDPDPPQWRRYLPDDIERRYESPWWPVAISVGIGILGIIIVFSVMIASAVIAGLFGLSFLTIFLLAGAIGQYVGFFGLGLLYLRVRGFEWERIWAYLGVRWPTLKEIAIGVASWLLIVVVLLLIQAGILVGTEVFGFGEPEEPDQGLDEVIPADPRILLVLVAFMFLVVGPCEELLFRGVIQGRLRERLPALPAIVVASAIFAAAHVFAFIGSLQAVLMGIFVLFGTSLVIGAVYEYTESLVSVSILHGLHNSIVVAILYAEAHTDLFEEGFTTASVVSGLLGNVLETGMLVVLISIPL